MLHRNCRSIAISRNGSESSGNNNENGVFCLQTALTSDSWRKKSPCLHPWAPLPDSIAVFFVASLLHKRHQHRSSLDKTDDVTSQSTSQDEGRYRKLRVSGQLLTTDAFFFSSRSMTSYSTTKGFREAYILVDAVFFPRRISTLPPQLFCERFSGLKCARCCRSTAFSLSLPAYVIGRFLSGLIT